MMELCMRSLGLNREKSSVDMKGKPEISTAGQSMVEFALIISILVLFILVIIDLGRITYSYTTIKNAASEGARYGIVDYHWEDEGEIENFARNFLSGLTQSNTNPLIEATTEITGTAGTVSVFIAYEFRTASPVMRILIGTESFTLETSSVMDIEYFVSE